MARVLRLKCPGCSTQLELEAGVQEMLHIDCPTCGKHFAAKVPRLTNPGFVSAKPIGAPPTADPFADLSPAAPFPAQQSPPAAPMMPQAPMPSSPMYQVPRAKRKPFPVKWVLIPVFSLLGLGILIPLGIWAASALSDFEPSDLTEISVVADSHGALYSDVMQRMRQNIETMNQELDKVYTLDEIKSSVKKEQAFQEKILVRASKLGSVSSTQSQVFENEMKQLIREADTMMVARMKSDLVRKNGETANQLDDDTKHATAVLGRAYNAIVFGFMTELPQPKNEREKVYFAQADICRKYFKTLAGMTSESKCKRGSEELNTFADELFELALKRASLGKKAVEFVPSEYEKFDAMRPDVEKGLVYMMRRDAGKPEHYLESLVRFKIAYTLVDRGAFEADEAELRSQWAKVKDSDIWKSMSYSLLANLGFKPEEIPVSSTHSLAIPTLGSNFGPLASNGGKQEETPSSTKPSSSSNAPQPSGSRPNDPSASLAQNDKGTSASSGSPSSSSPSSSSSGLASPNSQSGTSGQSSSNNALSSNASDPSRNGSMFPQPPFGPNGPRGAMFGPPGDPNFGPNFGPGFGPMPGGGNFPGPGSSMPPEFNDKSLAERFGPPNGVRVLVDHGKAQIGVQVNDFLKSVGAVNTMTLSSGSKTRIGFQNKGDLKSIAEKITFGKVVEIDNEQRIIRVEVGP
ncbi:MAG: hypothetical protein U0892_09865 [Pirellulales bacterium]